MTKAKHTPGPWGVEPLPDSGSLRRVVDADGQHVTKAVHCTDAAMISAAPDMLAALERVLAAAETCPCCDAEIEIVKAAIRKARGE